MTLWLVLGSLAALLGFMTWRDYKSRKAGRAEAEGEHLANYAEKIGKISESNKEIDEKAEKIEPKSDAEWDDFFEHGRRPDDKLRRKPGDKG